VTWHGLRACKLLTIIIRVIILNFVQDVLGASDTLRAAATGCCLVVWHGIKPQKHVEQCIKMLIYSPSEVQESSRTLLECSHVSAVSGTVCIFSVVYSSWLFSYHVMLRRARWCLRKSSVCLSVCDVHLCYYTGWYISKIISRSNSVGATDPNMVDLVHGNTSKNGVNKSGARSTETCNISETVQYRTKVTMTVHGLIGT